MSRLILLALLILSVSFSASIEFEIEEQSCPESAGIIEVLFNLPNCIVEAFFNTLMDGFIYGAEEFLVNTLLFINSDPDIYLFCAPYTSVMNVLEAFYTIAFMIAGIYYILKSHDVEGRTNAKFWLKNIFIMIVALSFSFSLFEMILEINEYVTTSLYNESFDDLLVVDASLPSLVFAATMSTIFFVLTGLTFITLLARYIMIPFLLLLFPIAIFLYFLPGTREWGAFLLKFILLIVFITSIDAVLVLAMSYLLNAGDPNISSGFVSGFVIVLGFGLIGLVNSMIYIISMISLMGAAGSVMSKVMSAGWKIALLASLV